MAQEKRKHKRKNSIAICSLSFTSYFIELINVETNQVIGHLVDISIDGMQIVCDEPIMLHRDYHLKLVLPDSKEGKQEIIFDGCSIWCNPGLEYNNYFVGFQFMNFSNEKMALINHSSQAYLFEN